MAIEPPVRGRATYVGWVSAERARSVDDDRSRTLSKAIETPCLPGASTWDQKGEGDSKLWSLSLWSPAYHDSFPELARSSAVLKVCHCGADHP